MQRERDREKGDNGVVDDHGLREGKRLGSKDKDKKLYLTFGYIIN